MKVEVDEKVYIQKYDVAFIMRGTISFPRSLMDELFDEGEGNTFRMKGTTADACKFAYSLEHPENVSWILSQDWILDYNEYAKMSLEELKNMVYGLIDECRQDIDMFNSQTLGHRMKNYRIVMDKSEECGHKIASLNLLIREREGKINFKFPKNAKIKMPRKIKRRRFLARLFGRGN